MSICIVANANVISVGKQAAVRAQQFVEVRGAGSKEGVRVGEAG